MITACVGRWCCKKIMIWKAQGKTQLLLPGWNVAIISVLTHSTVSGELKEWWSGTPWPSSVDTLAEEGGTWWYFLADKLQSSWKPSEIMKRPAVGSATVVKSLYLDWCMSLSQGYVWYYTEISADKEQSPLTE